MISDPAKAALSFCLVLAAILLSPGWCGAQYMYMDTDGDGLPSPADGMQANGSPTTVKVYLYTNRDRFGAVRTCGDGMNNEIRLAGYAVNLQAVGGLVSYSTPVPNPHFNANLGGWNPGDGVGLYVSYANSNLNWLPEGGPHLLFTVVVTGTEGNPRLEIVSQTSPQIADPTYFYSSCYSGSWDVYWWLGTDWSDTDVLPPFDRTDHAPTLTAIGDRSVNEGAALAFWARATDPDYPLQPLSFSLSLGTPPAAGAYISQYGYFSWTPNQAQGGATYPITVEVSDGSGGTDLEEFWVRVNKVPVLATVGNKTVDEETPLTFVATAVDLDLPANTLTYSLTLGSPAATDAQITPSGTFAWTPTEFQGPAVYPITVAVSDGVGGTDSEQIQVAVNEVNKRPVIVAPSSVQGATQSLLSFQVSASDPDGVGIRALTASPLPDGAVFSDDGGTASFSWVPTYAQAGVYPVTILATSSCAEWVGGWPGMACDSAAVTVNVVATGPLILSAPAARFVNEGESLGFEVTASDPDGPAIESLTAAPLPPGATFAQNGSNTVGAFSWTPDYTQAGVYPIVFSATNDGTVASTTSVTVTNVDRPPVIQVPSAVSGEEGDSIAFQAIASDPDGDPIETLRASPVPSGATFAPAPGNLAGTFAWTPGSGQAGSYAVTISATSACRAVPVSGGYETICATAETTTLITVLAARPPDVVAPVEQSVEEGSTLEFQVTATDPDGQAIETLTAGPLPTGATFVPAADRSQGVFHWTPGYDQAGTHLVTFTAANELAGSASTEIGVAAVNRAPVVTAPTNVAAFEGSETSFTVSASDPDGDTPSISKVNLPIGSTCVASPDGSIRFAWTPGYYQAGQYVLGFYARDSEGAQSLISEVTITVHDVDREPIAVPGGPYSGLIGVAVTFNGTGSMDPDGEPISARWEFGDGASAAGLICSHTYGVGGSYAVNLTVSDGVLSRSAATSATIQDVFEARAFTTSANATIRLGTGKASWCAQLEPIGPSYRNEAVLPNSKRMTFGTGRIFSRTDKASSGTDKDGNGIAELTACFSKTDLRALFSGLPAGTSTVTVVLEGDLSTGGHFRADQSVDVVNTGPALVASITPNPLSPEGTLTFRTGKPGPVRVSLFDVQGRLVRLLLARADLPTGYHDVRIDGFSDTGVRLASGVYFYRIDAAEGATTGRFAVTR